MFVFNLQPTHLRNFPWFWSARLGWVVKVLITYSFTKVGESHCKVQPESHRFRVVFRRYAVKPKRNPWLGNCANWKESQACLIGQEDVHIGESHQSHLVEIHLWWIINSYSFYFSGETFSNRDFFFTDDVAKNFFRPPKFQHKKFAISFSLFGQT